MNGADYIDYLLSPEEIQLPEWVDNSFPKETYEKQRKFGDSFMSEVSALLGQALIMPAPQIEDSERNTDLIVLGMNAVRIGCRIRQPKYLNDYGTQFTIRAKSQNGGKTEITKIIEGWGDYMFYGFASRCNTKLDRWTIIKLNDFRIWFMREMKNLNGKTPGIHQKNGKKGNKDNTEFLAFDLCDMPEEIVLACNWDINRNKAA